MFLLHWISQQLGSKKINKRNLSYNASNYVHDTGVLLAHNPVVCKCCAGTFKTIINAVPEVVAQWYAMMYILLESVWPYYCMQQKNVTGSLKNIKLLLIGMILLPMIVISDQP